MIDINYKGILTACGIALLFMIMLVLMVSTSGCITATKNTVTVILATPTPTPTPIPTPTPTPTPTPKQTPVSLPTIKQQPVDPFIHGERWEGQWFKWHRPDVLGTSDLDGGIIVYRHAWLDNYTWYNIPMGQYYKQEPIKGNRYFAVWITQEAFGTDGHNSTGFFPFYEDAFRLQVKDQLIEFDRIHNPTCRILEFDNKGDYYNVITAPPLGYYIKKVGYTPETGGYVALRIGEIHIGKSNSESGYLLFEVPKGTMTEDVILLGNFARFGSAYWRFND